MLYQLRLSSDEIAGGKLFQIQDTLTDASDGSLRRVLGGERGLIDQRIETFLGEDPLDVSQVTLLLNETAHRILMSGGVIVEKLEQVDESKKTGGFLSIPFYA